MDYREINNLLAKYIRERNNPNVIDREFREALIKTEEALRELKRFYWLKLLLYELWKQIVIQFSRLPDGLDNDFKKQKDIESVMWVDTGSE